MRIQVGFASIHSSWCPLERCQKAIHLRTGDGGTDGAISNWLEDHGVEVIGCADPFEACTFALTRRETRPDLAFVGADWLARDELAVIDYLRETWPGLATVIYGRAPATAGFQAAPLTLVCRSAAAVQRILADSPDELLSQLRKALRSQAPTDDGWRPQPKAPPDDEQRASAPEAPAARPAAKAKDTEQPPTQPGPRATPPDADETPEKPPPASGSILTQEELAALLDNNER